MGTSSKSPRTGEKEGGVHRMTSETRGAKEVWDQKEPRGLGR